MQQYICDLFSPSCVYVMHSYHKLKQEYKWTMLQLHFLFWEKTEVNADVRADNSISL